jgi:hypothetical protein
MLKAHLDAHEALLAAFAKVQSHAGHTIHKGSPRELFVREFLHDHLPPIVSIGTGEVIDAASKPGEPRNQHDIVIFRNNYPKLYFGGGISAFLVESVVATIEVKSTLSKDGLGNAIKAAHATKALVPHVTTAMHTGYLPPTVLNYVMAYDCDARMSTVYKWIGEIHDTLGITDAPLPVTAAERIKVPAPSLDAIFVAGKGFAYFDNVPYSVASDELRAQHTNMRWVYADAESGNLLMLFLFLHAATSGVAIRWLNPIPYLNSVQIHFAYGP